MKIKHLVILALTIGVAGCGQSSNSQNEVAVATTTTANAAYNAMNPPITDTARGKLRGYMDDETYAFIGIQYATAERFKMPQEVEPWEGVKDAQAYGTICPIPQQTSVGGDEFVWPHRFWPENENCQFLNIWTQSINPAEKKPVMVFFHGGGFTNGSSIEAVAYDGANLSEFGDVVTVTLNHRLNILGTLNMSAYGEQYAKSGNTGMADIEAALRWIQENIESFGGDPNNVTIFGQSGGSGKVVHMMHMPSAEGLFHKGIAQSSGSAAFMTPEESARVAELMLEMLGLDASQASQLESMPYYDLLAVGEKALAQVREEFDRNVGWRPVEDGEYILSEYAEWTNDMPMIIGTNFSERSSTIAIGDGRKNEWTEAETMANLAERFGDDAEQIQDEFIRLFPDKKPQDAYFYAPNYRNTVWESLNTRMSQSEGPVYNYLFSFEAPVNGGITPFHCAELIYVFHNVELPELKIATGGGPDALKAQDATAGAWVAFAYTGNPSQEELEWQPFTNEGRGTMVFDSASYFSALDDRQMVEMMSSQ